MLNFTAFLQIISTPYPVESVKQFTCGLYFPNLFDAAIIWKILEHLSRLSRADYGNCMLKFMANMQLMFCIHLFPICF